MKLFSPRSIGLICPVLVFATLSPAAPSNKVTYNPPVNIVQGNQPLTDSYVLTITSPSTLIAGDTVNLTLGLSVLSKPATGVSDAEALGFISVSPAALTFTGPNQQLTTTVQIQVPLGNYAGDYAYRILPSGWPNVPGGIVDGGATVNALVSPPASTDTTPPTVTLQNPPDGTVYTYSPASGSPVTVPVDFSASVGANGSPIETMLASMHTPSGTDLPISLTTSALPALSATASGSVQMTAPGNYTMSVAAGNSNGTSYASSNISVVVDAPPPTIAISSPTADSTFSYTLGGAGASVPVAFTATSIYGNITSLAATLDGNPVTLITSGVGTSTVATGGATLIVSTTGGHSLVFSAANDYGSAVPVTIPFTITGTVPVPDVAILSPADGSSYTRAAGDPPTVVNYDFQGGTAYGTISSVVVSLDGVPVAVAPTVVGLNTASITGSGSVSFSAGGSHSLNVKLTNSGGAMASASTSFTINESRPQICEDLTWLPPVSLNKTVEGGAKMPIKFTLECHHKFVRDTSVLIAIYEVFRDGSTSTPVIYPYGSGSPNPPDYAIAGKQYHLNFPTAKGTHSYQIEVYTSVSGTMSLLGTKELNTKGGREDKGHGDDD
ncbi:MAG: hypothetical protein HYV75_09405, partial [Opitutae bacterium]|nr:hypothetical protein [Opitutae bacterium]